MEQQSYFVGTVTFNVQCMNVCSCVDIQLYIYFISLTLGNSVRCAASTTVTVHSSPPPPRSPSPLLFLGAIKKKKKRDAEITSE